MPILREPQAPPSDTNDGSARAARLVPQVPTGDHGRYIARPVPDEPEPRTVQDGLTRAPAFAYVRLPITALGAAAGLRAARGGLSLPMVKALRQDRPGLSCAPHLARGGFPGVCLVPMESHRAQPGSPQRHARPDNRKADGGGRISPAPDHPAPVRTCGRPFSLTGRWNFYHFCSWCGADMRKEAPKEE